MVASHLSAGWDTLLFFGVPLIALLIFGFFRLDQAFTASDKQDPTPDPSQGPRKEPQRTSPLSDPDGRPWAPRGR